MENESTYGMTRASRGPGPTLGSHAKTADNPLGISEVERTFAHLQDEVMHATNLLEGIEKSLGWVLRPEVEDIPVPRRDDGGMPKRAAQSPLGERLEGLANAVRTMSEKMQSLQARNCL